VTDDSTRLTYGVVKKPNLQLYQSRYITETVQASDELTTECEDKVICGPSNGAISNDLE